MATRGLSISRIVNVSVNISPIAAGYRNFGVALLLGSSDIIDVSERVRPYNTLDEVAADFGSTAGEFLAAELYFSQQPRPNLVYIGRWAQAAAPAVLHGGTLPVTSQDVVAAWNPITAGGLVINVSGTPRTASALNFSGATNMNGVAAIIQAALAAWVTVTWNAVYERFEVKTLTTGATATLGYATAPGTGTDISTLTGLTAALASAPVAGVALETPLDAVLACANASSQWYGLIFATATMPTDNQLVDVAAYIEGTERNRIFGVTGMNSQVLDPLFTTDIASRMKTLQYKRTFVQYSSSNKYAAASAFARGFTVDFNGSNTTITLKFKQEPGIAPENLTLSQVTALEDKNANVFVEQENDTAILEQGKMANGYFFDEVHNSDWLANRVQNDLYNVLYQSQTKIPQTDAGMTQLVAAAEGGMIQSVENGMCAPGLWTGPDIGTLKTNTPLSKGYFIWMPLVRTQAQADREARKAPTMHSVNTIINVNL
jgi:hypothetical protein